jgi:hypothetical protein
MPQATLNTLQHGFPINPYKMHLYHHSEHPSIIGALLSIIAVISALRGEKYIPEREILLF